MVMALVFGALVGTLATATPVHGRPSPNTANEPTTAPAPSPELAREAPDRENPGRCVIIGPSKSSRWRGTPGIDQADLKIFDKANDAWAEMAQRYREKAIRVGPSASPRLVKSDDCGFMKSFARTLNDGFYAMPTMECAGGGYIYRYRPLGAYLEMDTIQVSHGPQGERRSVIDHDWVDFTATGSTTGCQIRVTPTFAKPSQFKMCLQSLAGGPARVAMLVKGHNLPREAMNITCQADATFAATVKDFVQHGQAPRAPAQSHAPASAPASYGPSNAQPADDNFYVH